MAAGSGTQHSTLTQQQKRRVEEFSIGRCSALVSKIYNEDLNANSISLAGPRRPADWPRHRRLVAWKMAVTSYFIEAAAGPIFTPAENVE